MQEADALISAIATYQQRWTAQGWGRAYAIEAYAPEALRQYAGELPDGWAGVVHYLQEELGVLDICLNQPLGPGARPYRAGLDGKKEVLEAALAFARVLAAREGVTP